MISNVLRNLKFGDANDIRWLHEWQELGTANQQLLIDLEAEEFDAFSVRITIKPRLIYEVRCYSKAGQVSRIQYATSINEVWNEIAELEMEHRVMRAGM